MLDKCHAGRTREEEYDGVRRLDVKGHPYLISGVCPQSYVVVCCFVPPVLVQGLSALFPD